jgi:lipopolysaccharide/colanic/teichoic acid biosynthesis glycosyltransferase
VATIANRIETADGTDAGTEATGLVLRAVVVDVDELTCEPESLAAWRGAGLSRWQRFSKRTLDVAVSLVILVLATPLLAVLTALVKLTSPGPTFFVQERIGQFGSRFKVVKLRTMRCRPVADSSITIAHDPRVTAVGTFLRATRLDELPQVWNVLKGEMSLVGPRPDVPGFADELRGSARRILLVRPGITGPATLYFRNEAELLAEHSDPEWLNDQVIYPHKVQLNLAYLDSWTFRGDVGFLLVTALPLLNRWLRVVPDVTREHGRDELLAVPGAAAVAPSAAATVE